MFLKKVMTLVASMFVLSMPLAANWCCEPQVTPYVKIVSGVTFPCSPNVSALPPAWDSAIEGYNSDFDTRPILGGAIGAEVGAYGALDLSLAYRGQFNYEKFQTPGSGASIDPLGVPRTRRFNLDATSLLCSVYLYGRCFECLTWQCGSGVFYPVVGVGVGTSRIVIWDFRTTGLPPLPGNETLLAFSGDNQYSVRWRFTYQASAGFEYRHCDSWALGFGYRWFDAGRFSGPRYFRDKFGGSFDAGNNVWKMSLRSNELYVDLKLFF